ncbi:hypothetical protein KAK06_01125 [Ideonella sp. 4Y11]|uniref:Protease n=1 Tax=Ideonella aquatica TaxID=2824119 RepID=A0A940YG39_9BURK|nr:hypothetical protein [Ideonella aquatica]MBQ0957546.1 hypothetical protein [Ideonella aquatica]
MKRWTLALLVAGMAVSAGVAAAPLSCSLQVPVRQAVGQALLLQFTLTNTGTEPLWVLRWNTPWEGGWMAPFVALSRDGQALDYQGAMVKRAAPDGSAYLHLAPGQALRASIPLAPAFELRRAGRYLLQPAITLGDVQVQQGRDGPRLGQAWSGVELPCGEGRFELLTPR